MRLSLRRHGIAALALAISGMPSLSDAAITEPTTKTAPSAPASAARPSHTVIFTYEASYPVLRKAVGRFDVWIPLPWHDENQEITQLVAFAPGSGEMTQEPEYGNRLFHFTSGRRGGVAISIRISFRMERFEVRYDDLSSKPAAPPDPPPNLPRYLTADRFSPIDDEIKALAARITKGSSSTEGKARAIYDHVVENMKLDKSGDDWGRGDLKYITSTKKGNSLDLSAAFVGLSRAADIPARVVLGFKLPREPKKGTLKGYHAWAEFYLEGLGWVPVDCADAVSDASLRDARFGTIDPYRVQISVGRDIMLQPPQAGDPINYWLYPYGEGDGKPLGHSVYRFQFEAPPPETAETAVSSE
jgi:transglutaminase-like putative cysteine protease